MNKLIVKITTFAFLLIYSKAILFAQNVTIDPS